MILRYPLDCIDFSADVESEGNCTGASYLPMLKSLVKHPKHANICTILNGTYWNRQLQIRDSILKRTAILQGAPLRCRNWQLCWYFAPEIGLWQNSVRDDHPQTWSLQFNLAKFDEVCWLSQVE